MVLRIAMGIAMALLFVVALYENNALDKKDVEIKQLKKENKELEGTPVIRSAVPQKEVPCGKEAAQPHPAAKKKETKHFAFSKKPLAHAARTARAAGAHTGIKPEYAADPPRVMTQGDVYEPSGTSGSVHEESDLLSGLVSIFRYEVKPELPGNEGGDDKPGHEDSSDMDRDWHGAKEEMHESKEGHAHENEHEKS